MFPEPTCAGRALIIDQHTRYPVELCRALARQGYLVDIFAEPTSPILRSRFCHRRFLSPPWHAGELFLRKLQDIVEEGAYDAIYLCSEEILATILPLVGSSDRWKALPLTEPASLKIALSKNAALQLAADAGVPVPRTVISTGEREVESLGQELGFPLIVKGERGVAAQNVRIVRTRGELLPRYREVEKREREYGGRPALQEFIPGPKYVVGGLFHSGKPLRVCAHRKVLMNPPEGGVMVKGVTERPPGLLENAFKVFAALQYTGLGDMDFIRDVRDGQFKFLEINPRVWAGIGFAQYAGVDFYTPYRDLARGVPVRPDLQYREGVRYHRFWGEVRLLLNRPSRIFGFVRDCLDPQVHSDFKWRDLGPHLPSLYPVRNLLRRSKPAEATVDLEQPGVSSSPLQATLTNRTGPANRALLVREVYERDEWNALVLGLPNSDLRQGYEWGEVRAIDGWTPRRIAIFRGESCVAAASIVVKQFPLVGRSHLYASGGPLVADVNDERAWEKLQEALRAVAAETRAAFLRISPKVPNQETALREALVKHGFRHLPDDWTTWNAPRIRMTMDVQEAEEALKRKLRRRHREYIASASKQAISVRPAGSVEEAREFQALLAAAGRRKGLPVRGRRYFEALWEEYVRPGRGVLLRAEHQGKTVGGLLGAMLGPNAYMLHVAVSEGAGGKRLNQGPVLYWEFIRWAKAAGCEAIDWGGIGTNFPPRQDDPGFGVYHFKLGFNSSLEYLAGYYDLVFSPFLYGAFRFLERWGSALAWTVRAQLNGRSSQIGTLVRAGARRVRQFRLSAAQRGIWATLYWAAFGYLRPNRFVVLARNLSAEDISWTPRAGVTLDLWEASALRTWRENRQGLSPEFFQDEIDGVDTCAVVLVKGQLAGLIWIYPPYDPSRLFRLQDGEAELNNGYVLPEYRGMGLFKDILSLACCWLRDQGCRVAYAGVHSANAPSLRAFRNVGFRDIGSVWNFLLFRPKFRGGKTRNESLSERPVPRS